METNPAPQQRRLDPDNPFDAQHIVAHADRFPVMAVAIARARLLDPWGR
jgi:hypothetical protein